MDTGGAMGGVEPRMRGLYSWLRLHNNDTCWLLGSDVRTGYVRQAARQIARVDGESQGNSYEGRR